VPTLKTKHPRASDIADALGRVSRVLFFAFWAWLLAIVLFFAVSSHASLEAPLAALITIAVCVVVGVIWFRWAFARGQKYWKAWALFGAAGVVAWVLYWR
jgi:hypothetical protein